MKLTFLQSRPNAVRTDLVALFVPEDRDQFSEVMASHNKLFHGALQPVLDAGDFRGQLKETTVVYLDKAAKAKRVLLIGLGERKKISTETYRRAAAAAAKKARQLRAKSIALALPELEKDLHDSVKAFAEGAYLSLYRFDKYMSKKEDEGKVESIVLSSTDAKVGKIGPRAVDEAQVVSEATVAARDLANAPGNEIYPETLARAAQKSGKKWGFRVAVLKEKEIARSGMGGVIGVCQGSARPPRFIIMEYGPKSKPPVVLVGKGVTFDTGGISIKPSANMAEMKMDMSGAAAVIGAMEAVARLKLAVHVVGLVPAVENMPSGSATRPGDIIRHFNGKTSEVDNTDAEGRLILADALGYAERYKPAAVIDLATLTGACVVALGHVATGMMGNDEALMAKLKAAGEATYERVWELPLFDEYERLIKSDVADVKNTGGRWAGAITAGWFLKKFIGNYKWAHLDIAGTAMLEENGDYTQKGASGVGVRLLAEFLKHWK
ncbi:MAG TPA: leucyl aminopeptidase [Bacteroidota bacterium]|nr:leucyl aminopeptidase [Bacteroidota bacterium]